LSLIQSKLIEFDTVKIDKDGDLDHLKNVSFRTKMDV